MTIDLSQLNISSWVWIVTAVVVIVLILRFFSHLVAHVFHIVISFFWHGCATAVVLVAIYFVLRAFHIL